MSKKNHNKRNDAREVARAEIIATVITLALSGGSDLKISVSSVATLMLFWVTVGITYLLIEEDTKGIIKQLKHRKHYTRIPNREFSDV